ncbi:MAG: DUF4349 domain-containing protein [Pseudomonadota bacterium]
MRGITMTAAGLMAMTLAGCGDGQRSYSSDAVNVEMAPPSSGSGGILGGTSLGAAASVRAPGSTPPAAPAVQASQIAYVYHYGLELPAARAPELMRRHEAACVAAGPNVCQVIGADTRRYGHDSVSATLKLRAAPAFLNRFRAGLEGDAEKAGGRVASASTESEDLTRDLSDTEARVRALTTLRDRLQQLLATRAAPLDQLLATERELARAQGELDATTSALNAMRTRVAMSRLTLEYRTAPQFASEGVFAPVSNAINGSLGAFMGTLGVLIYTIAVLLPLGLLLAPLVWLGLRWRRRRLAARAAAAPPAD